MNKPLSHLPKSKNIIQSFSDDLDDAVRDLQKAKKRNSHPLMVEIRQRRVNNLSGMLNYLKRYL